MSKVIKCCAAAIYKKQWPNSQLKFDDLFPRAQQIYLEGAKAVLEALLEPDDEVINAGIRAGVDLGFGVGRPEYEELWKAFTTEALKC